MRRRWRPWRGEYKVRDGKMSVREGVDFGLITL